MKARRTDLTGYWCTIIVALALSSAPFAASTTLAQTVTCDETTLSVNAADANAEDLIRAIGNECAIKIIVRGEVFTEDVFSVGFENLPIRTGIERILRVVNMPNYMMHFEEASGRKRLVEIDLVGTKGGERQLTPSTLPRAAPDRPSGPPRQARRTTQKTPKSVKTTGPEEVVEPPDINLDEPPEKRTEPPEEMLEEADQELLEESPDELEESAEE